MIRVENLRKSFGATVAVGGVSFEIRAGETFGLLGPNGAGKTTTILMLVGALRPDAGTIAIDGATDPTRPEVRRAIGLAPQSLALYDELTGAENLAFFARMHGLAGPALKERVRWALDFAGLAERAAHRVKTYSGGMQRRLNLACALVHDPRVLFLDEPTAGVDPQSRNRLFENVDALRREGRTIVYTTHYMEEAQRLCDRVAILDRGRLLALDTVPGLVAAHGGKSVVEAVGLDGRATRVETDDAVAAVQALAARGGLARLELHRPDLETVFLALTGRHLRDE